MKSSYCDKDEAFRQLHTLKKTKAKGNNETTTTTTFTTSTTTNTTTTTINTNHAIRGETDSMVCNIANYSIHYKVPSSFLSVSSPSSSSIATYIFVRFSVTGLVDMGIQYG